jgi:hypothetical protein
MRRGYSEVGLGLEDPCSHFSIATPLTDIYGLAAALAIFFSTPERPITTEFLKAECRKYIAEFLQTGKIAIDPNAPPEYPFQKAIQYICYEQLCVIFSVLNSSEDYYEVETLDHGHRRWKCTIPNRRAATRHPQTFNSLEEVFTMYPSYPFFFTEKAIQQAEDAIVNKFRSERIPLIRPPELLKNAETLIKKREEDAEEIEGMEAILFLSRQQQPQKAAAAGGGAASTRAVSQPPQQRASILRITREEEEAYTLLFPAQQQQIHRARPTPARHVQHLPSASVISPSMAARGNFGMISSAASTTTSTQPPQRVPLLQRNLQTGTSADPYTHLGSPPRARREDTPAPGNRQQVPTVVHSATYGSFIAPASHSSSDGRPPRTLRSNTTAPGATNRQQLSQSGLGNSTRSSAFAAIRK